MPKFQKTTRRQDTVRKRPLDRDDITFLSKLQTELNTQDTMGNADPRFWVIAQTEEVPGTPDEHDEAMLVDKETGDTVKSLSELAEYLEEQGIGVHYDPSDGMEGMLYILRKGETALKDHNYEHVYATMQSVIDDVDDELGLETLRVGYVSRKSVIVKDTLFLTHKACEDHLRQYGYNYNPDAHAFAMTAVRSPEFETLLKLLQFVDWASVRV